MDKINLQIIRESFGRTVYSHKTYEKEFEIQESKANIFKWINIIALTIGSSALLGTLITDQKYLLIAGAIFTSIGLALAIFQLSFNPEEKAYKYKQSANQLWQIREKYTCLIADMMNEKIKDEEVVIKREQLLKELSLVYTNSLPTHANAYGKALKALKEQEEFTFSNAEINKFLPKDLWLEN